MPRCCCCLCVWGGTWGGVVSQSEGEQISGMELSPGTPQQALPWEGQRTWSRQGPSEGAPSAEFPQGERNPVVGHSGYVVFFFFSFP